jgi:hypothetical protein
MRRIKQQPDGTWTSVEVEPRHVEPPHPPHPPPGPGPGDNRRKIKLVEAHKAGTVFADGQNIAIRGTGNAEIIQVFSV